MGIKDMFTDDKTFVPDTRPIRLDITVVRFMVDSDPRFPTMLITPPDDWQQGVLAQNYQGTPGGSIASQKHRAGKSEGKGSFMCQGASSRPEEFLEEPQASNRVPAPSSFCRSWFNQSPRSRKPSR